MRITFTLASLLALAVSTAPMTAQGTDFAPHCVDINAHIVATNARAGILIGVVEGDLDGAVSIITVKEAVIDTAGNAESLVELTYVNEKDPKSGFMAWFHVVQGPGTKVSRSYDGEGAIEQGFGAFSHSSGKFGVAGKVARADGSLDVMLKGTICN